MARVLIILVFVAITPVINGFGDFVDSVVCNSHGMDITLKQALPPPRSGIWDLILEGHPTCPTVSKKDVGGGHKFTVFYSQKDKCGVYPESPVTPAWVSFAKVILLLKDDNGTVIADSVSCVYDTKFETSLLTFRGEITSQNLMYGGSLAEEGSDVEQTVYSSEAVAMDFYDQVGRPLQQRHVKLGDAIMFKIDVSKNKQVSKVVPENCYFSSSSMPEENLIGGQTLPFVRKKCFNSKNGMVRAFLPKMDRNYNGTTFEMRFPAFHFTEYGRNLFVHCTILACVADQRLCDPKPGCFGADRRKRDVDRNTLRHGLLEKSPKLKEVVMTKYIIIDGKGKDPHSALPRNIDSETRRILGETVCMETGHLAALVGSLVALLLMLIIAASCLAGRVMRRSRNKESLAQKRWWYSNVYDSQPPTYNASVTSLPTITSF